MAFSVNGQELQHALVTLQATRSGAPFSFAKFKSVKYKTGASKDPVTDSQGQQVSYTIKAQKIEGSISMLLSEWFRFRQWLRTEAAAIQAQVQQPIGILQVEFDLTVQYGATIATLQKDQLKGAMIQEEPRDSSDNQEALVVEIPLFILQITDDKGNSAMAYRA